MKSLPTRQHRIGTMATGRRGVIKPLATVDILCLRSVFKPPLVGGFHTALLVCGFNQSWIQLLERTEPNEVPLAVLALYPSATVAMPRH